MKNTWIKIILITVFPFLSLIYPQVYNVTGNISTPIVPVKNAEVTFIDVNDTTKKYSALTDSLGKYQLNLITEVNEPEDALPTKFELAQNYPNPFSNETAITYKLSEPADVQIKIYNVLGQEIRTFSIGEKYSGIHRIRWDGKDNFGKKAAAGIYFYMLQAGKETHVKKMVFGLGPSWVNLQNLTAKPLGNSLYTAKAYTSDQKQENGNNIFYVRITNTDSTQPQIFSQVVEEIIIPQDTSISFILEALGSWRKINFDVKSSLNDINFSDTNIGWIVGDDGMILYSSNSGETWQQQICPIKEKLIAVDFLDNSTGWILSQNHILKTTDGGNFWEVKYSDSLWTWPFGDIKFFNSKLGFAVCIRGPLLYGAIFKTIDGGETWQNITHQNFPYLTHVSIVYENNIWICGGLVYSIYSSNDSGLTWTLNQSAPPGLFRTIQFLDKYTGWLSGNGFYRTIDGGETWIEQKLPIQAPLFYPGPSYFVNLYHGCLAPKLASETDGFFQTIDGGQSWELVPVDVDLRDVSSVFFINNDLGWAVGTEGTVDKSESVILKYSRQ